MDEYPFQVHLDIIGCSLKIQCTYKTCADGIIDYFESLYVEASKFTPDVIIRCNRDEADRYLFRSREVGKNELLEGVEYLSSGNTRFQKWKFLLPPIPPFPIYPIKNRFVGLHAAAIERNNLAVIFVGSKGSGKSTISINMLKENKEYSLVTDETVLIYNRTSIIEPFPRAVHIWEESNLVLKKISKSANKVVENLRKQPSFLSRIIFLEPLSMENRMYGKGLHNIPPIETAQRLMNHHLDTGTDFHESITTLMKLANAIPAQLYIYEGYGELTKLTKLI